MTPNPVSVSTISKEVLRVKISARNVFAGTVKNGTRGAVNAKVVLALEGGDTVVAIITDHSIDSPGLGEDSPAYAIVKGSEVMIG